MKRKDFLRSASLVGVSTILPFDKLISRNTESPDPTGICALIPSETAGPFPLDLTANTFYFRKKVSEDSIGIPLFLKLKIIGDDNCLPMANLRVNIWHCSNVGLYSGYDNSMNKGQAGKTYCRGYQFTDINGIVELETIFPGWYNGRINHIHFQVYVSSSYSAISQLSFDIAKKNAIYLANPTLYPNGIDPTSFSQDNIFSDGYSLQLASLEPNADNSAYNAYLEVTIKGTGTLGVGHIEKENAKNFILHQNFPNPYVEQTSIPFELIYKSDVKLRIFDLEGKVAFETQLQNLQAGKHHFEFSPKSLSLPNSNYVYQIQVTNSFGTYTDAKMITAL